MGDLVNFTGITYGDVPVENVLQGAKENVVSDLVVLGHTKDGEYYFASSIGDVKQIIWMLEVYKSDLIEEYK